MHLYGNRLQDYIARNLDRSTLNALDAHVSNCFHCVDAIDAERADSVRWKRRGILGRLVSIDVPLTTEAHPQAAEEWERAAA